MSFDVIVAGLGAMGSAAAYHLAKRGTKVLGLDRFAPPHAMGSSHGKSRIIREAYFENPLYVPLVQRAYDCWADLERESGRSLLQQTGGLMLGPPAGGVVHGARASAEEHGLKYEELTAAQTMARAPAFTLNAETAAIWEPRAGVLAPETAIDAHLTLAGRYGAQLRLNEPVLSWRRSGSSVTVTTGQGQYEAEYLVISAGAWAGAMLKELNLPLRVERNVAYWFDPLDASLFDATRFPIFLHEFEPGKAWYGFPDLGDGVKVALHHQGATVDADTVNRTVGSAEVVFIRSLLERYLPAANGPLRESSVCLYTNTPDEHFILDRHPTSDRVIVASPCSGHGFKFSSAIGEIIAQMAEGRPITFDLAPFSLTRFRQPPER